LCVTAHALVKDKVGLHDTSCNLALQIQLLDDCFFSRAHLARAAFLALAVRCACVSLAALALPPLRPPRRPKATAAGFLASGWSIASSTSRSAFWKSSFLPERLGIVI